MDVNLWLTGFELVYGKLWWRLDAVKQNLVAWAMGPDWDCIAGYEEVL